jgi:hypothetical protein
MERLERLENLVYAQSEKMDRLEDLVYRAMHRDRIRLETGESESPKYEEQYPENGGISAPSSDIAYSTTLRERSHEPETSPKSPRSRGFPLESI